MERRWTSACDTPPTLRLARALVREVFPIFRVEFHRPRDQRRLTAEDCRDLIDAAVAHALFEQGDDRWPIFTRHGQPVRFNCLA
jgi:hypothetical protein